MVAALVAELRWESLEEKIAFLKRCFSASI